MYTHNVLTVVCRQYLAHVQSVEIIKKFYKTARLVICLFIGDRKVLKWIIKKQEVDEGWGREGRGEGGGLNSSGSK
jgi:hypothetical protein